MGIESGQTSLPSYTSKSVADIPNSELGRIRIFGGTDLHAQDVESSNLRPYSPKLLKALEGRPRWLHLPAATAAIMYKSGGLFVGHPSLNSRAGNRQSLGRPL